MYIIILFICLFSCSLSEAKADEDQEAARQVLYFQPNTTQIFTELYQAYGLLYPPQKTFFEKALYLDQSIPPFTQPLQPSNQAIFDHANRLLGEFHKRVGDYELYVDPKQPKPFFYTALGSKQLIVALVYAIALSEPEKKFLFVEQIPFYSGHPNAVTGLFTYPNARFQAFHDPAEIKKQPGEHLVEFVTSPNNPDGKFRKPLTEAEILIADFVFASSAFGEKGKDHQEDNIAEKNIAWVRKAREQGKHLFAFNSASKQFGMTGTRCGYIWYPLYDPYAASIFNKFFQFISYSTVAGSTSGLADFLNLIEAFLQMPDAGAALRRDAHRSLIKRHELIAGTLKAAYPGSLVSSIPGSPTLFAQLKDKRIPQKKAADLLLEDWGIVVNTGEPMGGTPAHIRMNLSGYSEDLAEFLNRLSGEEKYKAQDLLLVSKSSCSHRTLASQKKQKTTYVVNPGDCFIHADASKGVIELLLSPFIDYKASLPVTIRKEDESNHPVIIVADPFSIVLRKPQESAQLEWSQPHYLNGEWKIRKTD